MLREFRANQVRGEPRRRWFRDQDFDLYVWYRDDGTISGFQLCYDKEEDEHAFTWMAESGVAHRRVDSGEYGMGLGMTPVLLRSVEFPAARVRSAFQAASTNLDPEVRKTVDDILSRQ